MHSTSPADLIGQCTGFILMIGLVIFTIVRWSKLGRTARVVLATLSVMTTCGLLGMFAQLANRANEPRAWSKAEKDQMRAGCALQHSADYCDCFVLEVVRHMTVEQVEAATALKPKTAAEMDPETARQFREVTATCKAKATH